MVTVNDIISIVREASALMTADNFEITEKGSYENIVNALNFNKPTGIVAANNPENLQRMVEIVTAHTA